MSQPVPVQNNMVLAVVTTAASFIANFLGCCCFPITLGTGITAIVFASKVNNLAATGDEAGAQAAAKKAKTWSYVTGGLGALFLLLFILAQLGQSMGWLDPKALQERLQHMAEEAEQQK
jgi:hypothetical protein